MVPLVANRTSMLQWDGVRRKLSNDCPVYVANWGNITVTQGTKRVRDCVFCGRTPLTFEHVIPKWVSRLATVKEILDSRTHHGEPHYLTKTVLDADGKTADFAFVERGKKYPMNAIEVRVVCEPCNRGWMSALEVEVRPYLSAMIDGETTLLSSNQWENLGKWAVKTAMMFEFNDYSTISFSNVQRRQLYETGTIPGGVLVLAARFEDVSSLRLLHSGATIGTSDTIGVTALVFGKLALLVHNSSDPDDLDVVTDCTVGGAERWLQVWPSMFRQGCTHVAWSPTTWVNHQDVLLGATLVVV